MTGLIANKSGLAMFQQAGAAHVTQPSKLEISKMSNEQLEELAIGLESGKIPKATVVIMTKEEKQEFEILNNRFDSLLKQLRSSELENIEERQKKELELEEISENRKKLRESLIARSPILQEQVRVEKDLSEAKAVYLAVLNEMYRYDPFLTRKALEEIQKQNEENERLLKTIQDRDRPKVEPLETRSELLKRIIKASGGDPTVYW